MQALLRTATRASRAAQRSSAAGVRRMSGKISHEEEVKEMVKWKYITYAAIPICAATAVWDLSTGEHAHSHEPHYPYLRIRSKEFPWGDCPLFDFNCGKEHAEEGEGEEEAEE